ncbi:MAG: hypothetical protein AB8G05_00620 [Oligoflexales bacterium]
MFFSSGKNKDFRPNKKMLIAAITKGRRIGLDRNEIIEMATLLDKNMAKAKIVKMVDKILTESI